MDMYSLLAQTVQYHTQSGTQSGPPDKAFIVILIAALVIGLAIALAVQVVIILLLQNPLKAVPSEHRKIDPGMIWLLMIPLFNLFWNFQVYLAVSDSFKSYFNSVGRRDVGDCCRTIGMWYAICAACSIIPCLNYIAGPAGLVLLIIYLVKIHGLKNEITSRVTTQPPQNPQVGS